MIAGGGIVYPRAVRFLGASLLFLSLLACGPGVPGGPTMSGRMTSDPAPTGPAIQSNDVLAREAQANRTMVQHILIGWQGRRDADQQDPRANARSREEADALAVSILERVRAGEAMEALMAEYSEDPGSARSGQAYEVTPSASLVFEFKRLGLRLKVGEAGLVLSDYGWHVMKRVE